MSQAPVLCLRIDEEIQLRLHEEQYAEEYFALIERNRSHLRELILQVVAIAHACSYTYQRVTKTF